MYVSVLHRKSAKYLMLRGFFLFLHAFQLKFLLCISFKFLQGSSRTRDNHGEPLATSYHSKFLGTVDYIWYFNFIVKSTILFLPWISLVTDVWLTQAYRRTCSCESSRDLTHWYFKKKRRAPKWGTFHLSERILSNYIVEAAASHHNVNCLKLSVLHDITINTAGCLKDVICMHAYQLVVYLEYERGQRF